MQVSKEEMSVCYALTFVLTLCVSDELSLWEEDVPLLMAVLWGFGPPTGSVERMVEECTLKEIEWQNMATWQSVCI